MEQLTLDEAAARLGVSRVAVRKRAQRGTLSARKVAGQWVVFLPGIPTSGHPDGHPGDGRPPVPEAGTPGTPPVDTALVDELRGRVAGLERQLDVKDRQISELHTLLAQSQARALPAPAAAPQDVEPRPPRRSPWWRRRFGSAG